VLFCAPVYFGFWNRNNALSQRVEAVKRFGGSAFGFGHKINASMGTPVSVGPVGQVSNLILRLERSSFSRLEPSVRPVFAPLGAESCVRSLVGPIEDVMDFNLCHDHCWVLQVKKTKAKKPAVSWENSIRLYFWCLGEIGLSEYNPEVSAIPHQEIRPDVIDRNRAAVCDYKPGFQRRLRIESIPNIDRDNWFIFLAIGSAMLEEMAISQYREHRDNGDHEESRREHDSPANEPILASVNPANSDRSRDTYPRYDLKGGIEKVRDHLRFQFVEVVAFAILIFGLGFSLGVLLSIIIAARHRSRITPSGMSTPTRDHHHPPQQ
jgi:hypothetical protein